MAKISPNEFRTGVKIIYKGDLWEVVNFQAVHRGRGSAFVRTKLRNLKNGNVIEVSFSPEEQLEYPEIEMRNMVYLYNQGDSYVFMDNESYEQYELPSDIVGDNAKYLKEDLEVAVLMSNGEIIAVELPKTVELEVVDTPPGVKGDTVSGGGKPATLETGLTVTVPFFINKGDIIKVDTRTGEYVERVNK